MEAAEIEPTREELLAEVRRLRTRLDLNEALLSRSRDTENVKAKLAAAQSALTARELDLATVSTEAKKLRTEMGFSRARHAESDADIEAMRRKCIITERDAVYERIKAMQYMEEKRQAQVAISDLLDALSPAEPPATEDTASPVHVLIAAAQKGVERLAGQSEAAAQAADELRDMLAKRERDAEKASSEHAKSVATLEKQKDSLQQKLDAMGKKLDDAAAEAKRANAVALERQQKEALTETQELDMPVPDGLMVTPVRATALHRDATESHDAFSESQSRFTTTLPFNLSLLDSSGPQGEKESGTNPRKRARRRPPTDPWEAETSRTNGRAAKRHQVGSSVQTPRGRSRGGKGRNVGTIEESSPSDVDERDPDGVASESEHESPPAERPDSPSVGPSYGRRNIPLKKRIHQTTSKSNRGARATDSMLGNKGRSSTTRKQKPGRNRDPSRDEFQSARESDVLERSPELPRAAGGRPRRRRAVVSYNYDEPGRDIVDGLDGLMFVGARGVARKQR